MAKQFQLNVPDVCGEDWNEMNPTGCRRFCNSCQKQVVDFTRMDDRQLALFFQKNSENVCGRFRQDQLSKDLVVPRKQIPWFRYFLQVVIPAMLFSSKAYTQGSVRKILRDTTQVPTDPAMKKTVIGDTILQRTITGRVVDQDGKGIEGASVMLYKQSTGTITTKDGFFRLTTNLTDQEFQLDVTMIGYSLKQISYPVYEAENQLLISLEVDIREIPLMGVVVQKVVKTTQIPKKVVELKKHAVMDTSVFQVYPNPVVSGASINIELATAIREDYYEFSLVNFNGKTIFDKKVWIDKDARVMNIEIPLIANGNYFVVLRNKKLKKELAQQIVVIK